MDPTPRELDRIKAPSVDAEMAERYDNFIRQANLTDDQRQRFDQITMDVGRMFIAGIEHSDRVEIDAVEQDAWARLRDVLTPSQYRTFRHTIGMQYGVLATKRVLANKTSPQQQSQ